MKIFAILLFASLLSSCSVGRKNPTYISMPSIETLSASDSVLMELTFYGESPIAAKVIYRLDKNGQESTTLYYFTHRLRNDKLLVTETKILVDSALIYLLNNESKILKSAKEIEGYKLHWLDGEYWAAAINDRKGLRTFKYPELFQNLNSSEGKRIQEVFLAIDKVYNIDAGRWNMKLSSGKYSNYGGTEIRK